ncbi:MAG: hypothetical protein HY430_02935 [Candidatus Levybacteria bacterium]|nr:hypothetical protein [Candidatus Levybacteria bacterium]
MIQIRTVQKHARASYMRLQDLRSRIPYRKTKTYIKRRPFTSFFAALGFLLLFMILGSVIGSFSKKGEPKPEIVKQVKSYSIGKAPRVSLQARVEESGVVKIVAQTAGIVSQINVQEGATVQPGTNIIQLSTNYAGGNIMALQRQLAQTQYNNVQETFDAQKDVIKKQREIADKTSVNTEELRKISDESLKDTRSALSLNEDILSSIDQNLSNLETTNVGGANDALILQTKQLKSQYQSAVSQLRSGVRSLEFQVDTDNPPTELANLQKDLTLKQLEIQEKALDLNREMSRIQLHIAFVNESLTHPTSPIHGMVERIHVRQNQSVTPGTPLVTISGNSSDITAVVHVSRTIAQSVSKIEPSTFVVGKTKLSQIPTYISQNATDGQEYTIIYNLPSEQAQSVTDGEYITVDIPLGVQSTNGVIPYIPIDAIYQTQEESIVYIIKDGKALGKKVNLGNVYGEYVEVVSGLRSGDEVITNRNVVSGDKVKASL